jgi:predicted N-acetyltransferase YhbS
MSAPTTVAHLFEQPQHRLAVASLIHQEFWIEVAGASVQSMAARLGQALSADALPLCLVALRDGAVVGAVNLVDNDDDDHTDWRPWLAGLVVAQPYRGQGVGSMLVRSLLAHARRLAVSRVYFGTDGPGFYARLGAVVHEVPREGFWFMRFDL